MINAEYQQVVTRVNSLELRERVMLLICSIVFLYFLVDNLGLQPIFEKQQSLLADIKDQEIQFEVLRARSYQLDGESSDDLAIPLEQLQQEFNRFGQTLQSRLDTLLSPDKASSILEEVIRQEKGLSLNEVNTRLVPLTSIDADSGESVVFNDIKRYELQLQLEGGYLETLNYLRALEALPWKIFWSEVKYSVVDYPTARVDLEIYTLDLTGS